jgi:hypothetical protein
LLRHSAVYRLAHHALHLPELSVIAAGSGPGPR